MAFSLKKYRTKFLEIYHNFQKKKNDIRFEARLEMEQLLKRLQNAILEENKEECKTVYDSLHTLEKQLFPRARHFRMFKSFVTNALFLGVIIVLRQTWFEPFQIPTGSMRPTLKELDRLVVSKHQFGVNVPLTPDHFLFQPDEVKRGGIITFTGENMDIDGVKTKYFYFFDGYKQYVKRLIGKPGDTLYFYGGKIYGMDRDGNDISEEFQSPIFENLEHIPFMRLDGKLRWIKNSLYVYQYNIPVARIDRTPYGTFAGKVIYSLPNQAPAEHYGDLFGMHHFGMCRIEKEGKDLLLKIFHHPSLSLNRPLLQKQGVGHLEHEVSSIPLDTELLKTVFENLQTSRFVVRQGLAYPWDSEEKALQHAQYRPVLKDVPDGTYEFFGGQAYRIYMQGFSKKLDRTHPLMQFDPERTIALFNFGTELDTRFGPQSEIPGLFSSRYTYFRDQDLYVLGKKFLDRRDRRLTQFVEKEKLIANELKNYVPFVDQGPPLLKDGTLDKELISHYGLRVPEGKYLGLGDNHAVSADSRDFGFIPEGNLRGVPAFIITPFPNLVHQAAYPLWTYSKMIVVGILLGGWFISYFYNRSRRRFPLNLSY